MMKSNDFFTEENKEALYLFFNTVIEDLVDLKISSPAIGKRFDIYEFLKLSTLDFPNEEVDISEVYNNFKKEIIPYCQNPSSKFFLGFPYSGNSVPALTGTIISDFLNINLVDFKLSEALTLCEIQSIIWLRKLLGYDKVEKLQSITDAGGIHTHGGAMSNTIALILARENHNSNTLKDGVENPKGFKIIVPEGITHYGILKSQMLIGCGSNTIEIPTVNYRMNLEKLEKALVANKNNIMCVIAFAGDAKTGTVDNLTAISNIVKKIDHKIWLHVDASQGFCLAFSDTLKHKLSGIEHFDSITIDPHKCLNIPFSISTLLVKEPKKIKVFDDKDSDDNFEFSFGRISPFISSRPSIALKLWFTLKTFGKKKISKIIETRYNLAQNFAEIIKNSSDFILIGEQDTFSIMFYYTKNIRQINSDNEIEFLNDLNNMVEKVLLSNGYFIDRPKIIELPYFKNKISLRPLKYLCGNPITKIEDLISMLTVIRNEFNNE
ncbi:MAG: hypothetical protein IPL35_05255 [Sphingobacteriales bacterium]|nr:hypothetical protein [Sphingobacteriales bacterium]